jgi:hypothetical protein
LKSVYEKLISLDQIPKITNPFSEHSFKYFLITNKIPKKTDFKCRLCSKEAQLVRMRTHVAKHILNNKTVEGVCGFCGLTCDSSLEIRESSGAGFQTNFKPHSNCTYINHFNLGSVERTSKHSPCSNRPVLCRVCQQIVWSYNLTYHYKIKHGRITEEFNVSTKERIAVLNTKD